MWNGDKPETGTVQQRMSLQDALLGKTASAQTAVVKQFRSEITNGWVHSPCLGEKESHGFRNCLAVSHQILERGFLCPWRMAALEGALQLLRIANQDQVLGGLCDGDDIGEGHLPGLVDEQYVYGLEIFGPGPKPRGPSYNIGSTRLKSAQRNDVVFCHCNLGGVCLFIRPLHAVQASKIAFVRGFENFFKKFANDFVAQRGNADFFSLLKQLTDHASAGVGLARARGALDGEHGCVQRSYYSAGGLDGSFTRQGYGILAKLEARRFSQQQVASSSKLA